MWPNVTVYQISWKYLCSWIVEPRLMLDVTFFNKRLKLKKIKLLTIEGWKSFELNSFIISIIICKYMK